MRQDIQDFVDQTMPCQTSFKQLAAMLPADDAAIDAMLEETIRNVDGRTFPYILISALYAGRKVDSRHLEVGALLFTSYTNFLSMAWKLEGDVPAHLMEAMRAGALDMPIQAAAFFLMAAWEKEGRGPIQREEMISMARVFARKLPPTSEFIFLVVATAHLLKDEGLKDVLSVYHKPIPDEKIEELIAGFMKVCTRPVLDGIAARPDGNLTHGRTMRRAVARVGRNDPCPCGSGKKYKQCCLAKDEVRLQQSTEVEGVTAQELRDNMEEHLHSGRLARCNPPALLKIDPRKLEPYLLKDFFDRLARFRMLDKIAESFEQVGWREHLASTWQTMLYWAAHYRRKDVLQRLLRVAPATMSLEKNLFPMYRLLLAEDNARETLDIIMEQARFTLQADTPDMLQSFAMILLPSKLSPLGILVARGVLPFLSDEDAEIVFSEITRARDLLNLPPDDLYTDLMDERRAKKTASEASDSERLQEATRKLEDKAKEMRQMKEMLHQLQREISLREEKTDATPTPENVVQLPRAVDENALAELRNKVETLKSELKERHNERNELRRDLQKAQEDLERLRLISTPQSDSAKAKAEEEEGALLLPEESMGNQPVRLIEFPKKFEERLASFPRHVARNAMKTIGELASGDPAAFVGVVRLKAIPTMSRQRIGIDVRLLFKLLPDRIQVVDLINRKDLERRIKTLL